MNKLATERNNIMGGMSNSNDGGSSSLEQRKARSIYGDRGTKYLIMRSDPSDALPPYLKTSLFDLLHVSDYNNMGVNLPSSVQQNAQQQQQTQQQQSINVGNKNMLALLKSSKKK
jgi:hypothetical protein